MSRTILENYEIEWIAVKHLSVVWVQCQRPYNEKWAREIADSFDNDKFEPIIVTKPNGQGIYHIVEGQHRRHALEMFDTVNGPNARAPCRVIEQADPARAAEIWLGINKGRKPVKPVFEFKVAVVAKREPEVTINKIVHNMGYKISDQTGQDNNISAVSALKYVYNRYGDTCLKHTLQATRLLWGADPHAVRGEMVRGFGVFLHEFSAYMDGPRLKKQIGKFSPYEFVTSAKVRRESTQERVEEAIAENIRQEYNKGLKESARLRRKS